MFLRLLHLFFSSSSIFHIFLKNAFFCRTDNNYFKISSSATKLPTKIYYLPFSIRSLFFFSKLIQYILPQIILSPFPSRDFLHSSSLLFAPSKLASTNTISSANSMHHMLYPVYYLLFNPLLRTINKDLKPNLSALLLWPYNFQFPHSNSLLLYYPLHLCLQLYSRKPLWIYFSIYYAHFKIFLENLSYAFSRSINTLYKIFYSFFFSVLLYSLANTKCWLHCWPPIYISPNVFILTNIIFLTLLSVTFSQIFILWLIRFIYLIVCYC